MNKLEQLKALLVQKKSNNFYAQRLGISLQEVLDLKKKIREEEKLLKALNINALKDEYITTLEDFIVTQYEENEKDGKAYLSASSPAEIRTKEDLVKHCKIDESVWNIDRYIQNYWGNSQNPHWQVKVYLSRKSDKEHFQEAFKKFLSSSSLQTSPKTSPSIKKEEYGGCLILNKQDAHINKFDERGNNSIEERMHRIEQKISEIVNKSAAFSKLSQIIYILGSDLFNSEWTQATTKGTPQKNVESYHKAFELICSHEIRCIEILRKKCQNIQIMYIPGNHDEYVGWHLVNWIKSYYRNTPVTVDDSPEYTKTVQFGNTALLFNHGDDAPPKKLAEIFPLLHKKHWSESEYFYIFTGDKHTEKLQTYGEIQLYQLAALSNSRSKWDLKKGYLTRGEITGFLISHTEGLQDIYKKYF